MAKLQFVNEFGAESKERDLFGKNIVDNIDSARYTGSFLSDKSSDVDIFIGADDLDIFEELLNLLSQAHYFTLYEHTAESNYNNPWVDKIYRISFSERENDHIDVIVVQKKWYADVEYANTVLYKLYSYNSLPKKMRNVMMNETIQISHYLGNIRAKRYAYDAYSFALLLLKEDYLD